MRPTSHAVSKRLGAALLVLVRALLSSYRSYDWCLSIRPMTPEMWLDLEPIPHRASCNFAADRQNPSGIQHGVALLVAWLVISRSTA